ncbi:toll/interleukin-1 receptor domain-containing protein [Candidatus Villigracilis affinis]|uniref:toll/interleukin-1 receptor domain-containing protein n=1 Tax=Candidatus Villigracilis affinis TaxID=3140682 RepID=UPI002A1975DB|nr:toll/interleukin-1 receptor domain-containing protein [Anaerolineales bacterium]
MPSGCSCASSNDKSKVRQLYDRLKNEKGIDPWLDVEKLLPGVDWDLEITAAVKTSHVVLVCLSKDSINKEGYIQKEIKQALDVADEKPDGTIFIIPLRLEDCDVPEG